MRGKSQGISLSQLCQTKLIVTICYFEYFHIYIFIYLFLQKNANVQEGMNNDWDEALHHELYI